VSAPRPGAATGHDPPGDLAGELAAATVALHRDDADDLADALRHAGTLLARLAGDPAAEAAHHDLTGGGPELAAFALDLLVHAADLTDTTDTEDDQP
jgi:hypothetical protein